MNSFWVFKSWVGGSAECEHLASSLVLNTTCQNGLNKRSLIEWSCQAFSGTSACQKTIGGTTPKFIKLKKGWGLMYATKEFSIVATRVRFPAFFCPNCKGGIAQ